MSRLEKEMKEQETLIAGYQQENKRLYNELKNVQKQHKQTEEKMFKENQKLLAEASNLRYGKCSKISNTFLFLFSNKMLVSWAGIHKMLVRIANREDHDQTASSEAV